MTRTERIPKLPLLEKVVLTIDEACAISGMGRTTIYTAIRHGRLPARKRGVRTIILRADIDKFLDDLPRMHGREKVGEKEGEDEKLLQEKGL